MFQNFPTLLFDITLHTLRIDTYMSRYVAVSYVTLRYVRVENWHKSNT